MREGAQATKLPAGRGNAQAPSDLNAGLSRGELGERTRAEAWSERIELSLIPFKIPRLGPASIWHKCPELLDTGLCEREHKQQSYRLGEGMHKRQVT